MRSFKDLITNKRVIFVCSDSIYRGTNWGSWIDTFDTVIRSNNLKFPSNKLNPIKDFGKRCDILYINSSFSNKVYSLLKEERVEKDLKCIVFKSISRQARLIETSLLIRPISKETIQFGKSRKNSFYDSMIFQDLLLYKPKELWIMGIDLYERVNNLDYINYIRELYDTGQIKVDKIIRKALSEILDEKEH